MKVKSLLITLFALALALQINGSNAVHIRYRVASFTSPRIATTSLSLKTEPMASIQPNLSSSEKKLIDNASAIAFKELKKFYMIVARSRFG